MDMIIFIAATNDRNIINMPVIIIYSTASGLMEPNLKARVKSTCGKRFNKGIYFADG